MFKKIVSTKGFRSWQGIPGIELTPGGTLVAVFYSGGRKEPHPKNDLTF
jgi:hypothetical protein